MKNTGEKLVTSLNRMDNGRFPNLALLYEPKAHKETQENVSEDGCEFGTKPWRAGKTEKLQRA
jgi:hypothetical protein